MKRFLVGVGVGDALGLLLAVWRAGVANERVLEAKAEAEAAAGLAAAAERRLDSLRAASADSIARAEERSETAQKRAARAEREKNDAARTIARLKAAQPDTATMVPRAAFDAVVAAAEDLKRAADSSAVASAMAIEAEHDRGERYRRLYLEADSTRAVEQMARLKVQAALDRAVAALRPSLGVRLLGDLKPALAGAAVAFGACKLGLVNCAPRESTP